MPSIHIAKQWMQEADDLDVPPSLLCAINALTPRDSRTTHAFHAMVSNYSGPEAPQSIEYARGVIKEDEVVVRSEEHTSELQSLMRISYAVFCLKKKISSVIDIY